MSEILEQLTREITRIQGRLDWLETLEFATIADPSMALISTITTIQSLPSLRGFWPGNGVDVTGSALVTDLSGADRPMISGGTPIRAWLSNGTPYVKFSGSGQYLKRDDEAHWDITGTETIHDAADRGLTLGAWVYFDNAASSTEYVISKTQTATLSYWLYRSATAQVIFGISNSSTTYNVGSPAGAIPTATWTFLAGRFDPGAELAAWINTDKYPDTSGIPASIDNSTAAVFLSGRDDAVTPGQSLLTGRIAFPWICGALVSDDLISRVYSVSRHCFGV